MEDDIERLRITGFVTTVGSQGSRRAPAGRGRNAVPKNDQRGGHSRPGQAGTYLLIRLGVCVLLFCGVFALKLAGSGGAEALEALSRNGDYEQSDIGSLGKLRFVQIPSIIDVFAPSGRPALPAAASGYELLSDNTVLRLKVEAKAQTVSPCDGTVRDIGTDEEFGAYVRILSSDDTEYSIYGLGSITVEQGQSLTKNSVIGNSYGTELYVEVRRAGRPVDVSECFDLGRLG